MKNATSLVYLVIDNGNGQTKLGNTWSHTETGLRMGDKYAAKLVESGEAKDAYLVDDDGNRVSYEDYKAAVKQILDASPRQAAPKSQAEAEIMFPR